MTDIKGISKKRLSSLVILGICFLIALVSCISRVCGRAVGDKKVQANIRPKKNMNFTNNWKMPWNSDDSIQLPSDKYVAVLHVDGVICENGDTYSHQWTVDSLRSIQDDEKNMGLMLFIDSPGGTVKHADDLYLKIMKYKKETGRPVYAYFSSIAASGGYYIACAADYIVANRNCLTGSIGVIGGQLVDARKLMEKIGVEVKTIHSGSNKVMGHPSEGWTQEQADIMQSICDEAYDQFTEIVSDGRGMEITRVRELADGRIYSARQAKNNGLVDLVGDYDDAVSTMERQVFDFVEYEFTDFKYGRKITFQDLINGIAKDFRKSVSAVQIPGFVEEALSPSLDYPAYYYKK